MTETKIKSPFWRFSITLDSVGRGRSFHDGIINEPVSESAARELIEKQYRPLGVVKITCFEKIDTPDLTKNELLVLKTMLGWDQDYSYGYMYLEETGLDRKELKKCIKHLRELCLVKMSRGGVDDDTGEVVGGTGFYIMYDKRKTVEALLSYPSTKD